MNVDDFKRPLKFVIITTTVLCVLYFFWGIYAMNNKQHADITAADSKLIGFDYQYYYFLYKILSLRPGERAGFEVLDDVHTSLNSDKQVLFQLKHTTQNNAAGAPINLTELDLDLWKTLFNWAKVISDAVAGRANKQAQLDFIKKTEFVLVSNKSTSSKNKVLSLINEYHVTDKPANEKKKTICSIGAASDDGKIKECAEFLSGLDDHVFAAFIANISFELDVDDVIALCKEEIKAAMIPEKSIGSVFAEIDSKIRESNFFDIKSGKKIEISFDDFYTRYKRYYDKGRSSDFKIVPYQSEVKTDDVFEQMFVRQLQDIDDINIASGCLDDVIRFTTQKLTLAQSIFISYAQGDITQQEIDDFNSDSINRWRNIFRAHTRRPLKTEEAVRDAGCRVLDQVRSEALQIGGVALDSLMSNGQYYKLSDELNIGWRIDWESKYKK